MPTYTIDDRKAIAEVAAKHGWLSQVEDINKGPSLFRITYTHVEADERIVACYNKIDKMNSSVLYVPSESPLVAHRPATVKDWLKIYGSPESTIKHGSGKAELWRDGKLIATATQAVGGEHWFVYHEELKSNIAMLGGTGVAHNVTRKLVLAVLKDL